MDSEAKKACSTQAETNQRHLYAHCYTYSLVNHASQPAEESLANVRTLSRARLSTKIVDKYNRVVAV